ncbi:MAG: hypothetical protein PH343_08010, partial [Nitrospira sp.]|nr:hypothetical protein [Nitrospira sp.]
MESNCQLERKCLRCGYAWTPRKEGIPQICPMCKSTKWNEPKTSSQLPELGRGAVLKANLISEQRYLDAKKTVEAWETTHG